jgi:hypothetical protein
MDGPEVKVGDIGNAPIIPVVLILIGGYLAWFGIHYWRQDITWPSDPVKSVLQGKGVPPQQPITSSADMLKAAEQQAASSAPKPSGGGGGKGNAPPPPGASGNAARNQQTGKMIAARYGWSPKQDQGQWNALVDLWNRESGWNELAENPSSGAYGIPQSLPASKMATAGPDYLTNPATQIRWGLGYIKARYGSPEGAWAHEESAGWY